MRCKEFDAQIDEMLSGALPPDANQHMRQCERCTSFFRARSAVQNGLRAMASAPAQGPSRATDRAVMESYRRLQAGRKVGAGTQLPQASGRVVAFPSRGSSASGSRTRWGGLAVAAALLAVVGSGMHLWHGVSTVTAPSVAMAPAAAQSGAFASAADRSAAENTPPANKLIADNASRHSSLRQLQTRLAAAGGNSARPAASDAVAESSAPVLAATAVVPGPAAANGGAAESVSAMQQPANTSSILHLASAGGTANAAPPGGGTLSKDVAQSASSTWPGYSNLMYCDPVVCSGPMQVVHIKVPVGQVKPNVGQSEGNGFVNAEVVVGPDGVARAIRVAN